MIELSLSGVTDPCLAAIMLYVFWYKIRPWITILKRRPLTAQPVQSSMDVTAVRPMQAHLAESAHHKWLPEGERATLSP